MTTPSSDRNLYLAAGISCLSAGLFGYSIGFIGGEIVLPSFLTSFGLDGLPPSELALTRSLSVTAWVVGALIGVPSAMPVCSKFGRRWCLRFNAVLYVAGAVLQAFSSGNLKLFEVGRLINGMGVGAGTLGLPIYLAEIAPAQQRGVLMGLYQVFIQLGALAGFWIAFVCQIVLSDDASLQWQLPVALQLAGGAVLMLGCTIIPETPSYLAGRGDLQAMEKSLAWLRRRPVDDPALLAECLTIEDAAAASEKLKGGSFWVEIKKKDIRRRLHVGVGLMLLQTTTGINALNYYSPLIFFSAGFRSVSASLFLAGTFGLVKLLASLAFMFKCVHIKGNRFWLLLGSVVCGMSMLVLAYCVKASSDADQDGESDVEPTVTSTGILSVLMVYVFTFMFGVSWAPISWNVCAEIFPLHINSICCAITTCTQWGFMIVIAAVTPLLLDTMGWAMYAALGGACFVAFAWAALCVPETRGLGVGKPMDELFGADMSVPSKEDEVLLEVSETTALLVERNQRRSSVASFI